ncbi:hypothetical protein ACH5RR_000344 [Cinchona calisaya]|uniref:FAD-binding PCMH-type domain-containing protein n=1 Tax=Cinchona calisaya TaxID=153742 RepID=A0ABD3B0H1_9GENT
MADSFIHCISHKFPSNSSILDVLYLPNNSSYPSILKSTIQNLRFLKPTTPKPLAIITPLDYTHVQEAVKCCKQIGLQIRTRSGGHDYEGGSYTSDVPFVILDLQNLSDVHGFPAGICPTVGIGGHVTGGGVGNLMRKYGLASDNVIDAIIVDVNGRILDRKSMGEDLFWAIRGGGGASFGVIVAWKIRLVHVPPIVTVFKLTKSLEQGAINLVQKWQYISHNLSKDFYLRVTISTGPERGMIQATFNLFFLGRVDQLIKMMDESFPEIRVTKEDCIEMSWIESVLYFAEYPEGIHIEALRNRKISSIPISYFKGKSDLVHKPIPYEALEELWKKCSDINSPEIVIIDFHPFGGRMSELLESETPFPYRKNVLYGILYTVIWESDNKDGESSRKNINWLRELYQFMTPYVSHGPRGAFVNSKDLDLGENDVSGTSYSKAQVWGSKYFKKNFKRLAIVKGEVDPHNFFYHEQSIPPLVCHAQSKFQKCNYEFPS